MAADNTAYRPLPKDEWTANDQHLAPKMDSTELDPNQQLHSMACVYCGNAIKSKTRFLGMRRTWLPWILHCVLLSIYSLFFTLSIWRGEIRMKLFSKHEIIYSPASMAIETEIRSFSQAYGDPPYLSFENASLSTIPYAGTPTTEMDEAWYELYYPPVLMRLSKEEAERIDEPSDMLEDGSGYVVGLDVFHQLHCIDFLRKAVHPERYSHYQSPKYWEDHVAHCINYLRQAVMCAGDVTPLGYHLIPQQAPGSTKYRTDFSQRRRCRNYQKIYDWAMERAIDPITEHHLVRYPL